MSPSKRQTPATLEEPTIAAEPLTLVLAPDGQDELPTIVAPLTLPVADAEYTLDQPEPAAAVAPPLDPAPTTPPANDVQLVGRIIQNDKRKGGRYTKLHKGGEWLEYIMEIAEPVAPGVVETTQIPFLIPRGRDDLERSLRGKHLIRVHGRLDRDAEFDTRYGTQTTQHGTIEQRVFIKAGSIEVFEKPNEPAMHAVLRVTGTVQRVMQVERTLGRHDTQQFHLVRIKVSERYPRQAPATGMFTYEQTITVAVPVGDTESLPYLLRSGNRVALELGYRTINDWATDNHHSLEGVEDPKKRDWLRKQSKSFLTVTQATPLAGAKPIDDAEMARILTDVRVQQPKKKRRKQRQASERGASRSASPAR